MWYISCGLDDDTVPFETGFILLIVAAGLQLALVFIIQPAMRALCGIPSYDEDGTSMQMTNSVYVEARSPSS